MASAQSKLGRQGLPMLRNVEIAAPCSVPWSAMTGTERERTCSDCREPVFNLSGMTLGDARSLLAGSRGTMCVQYFLRHDGMILLKDCAVGVAGLKRQRRRLGLGAAALAMAAGGAGLAMMRSGVDLPAPAFAHEVDAPPEALPRVEATARDQMGFDEADLARRKAAERLEQLRKQIQRRDDGGERLGGAVMSMSFEDDLDVLK